jgi:septal ring factor EnvC (AmiA/AmiB activator)
MAYGSLFAPIVKSIQQQQDEIAAQKASFEQTDAARDQEIADLKHLIESQQKEIEELNQQVWTLAPAH